MVDLDRLLRVLVTAARERRPVTYGQLLAYFGIKVTRITVAALCRDLGRIEPRDGDERRPDLACLVVRKSDGLPGEGYFASLRAETGYKGPSDGPEARAVISARQEAAFRWAAALRGNGRTGEGAATSQPPPLPAAEAVTPSRSGPTTRAARRRA